MLHFVLIIHLYARFSSAAAVDVVVCWYSLLAFVIRFDFLCDGSGSAALCVIPKLTNSSVRVRAVCVYIAQSQVVIGLFNYLFVD